MTADARARDQKLSSRMRRMGDVVSSNHYAVEVELLEAENQQLKNRKCPYHSPADECEQARARRQE